MASFPEIASTSRTRPRPRPSNNTSNRKSKTARCTFCSKYFQSKKTLVAHVRKVHKLTVLVNDRKNNVKCRESDCNATFRFISHLRDHLSKNHGISMEFEKLTFKSNEEFELWKTCVEEANICSFILQCGARNSSGSKRTYYYCNRSGFRTEKVSPKEERKRKLKAQGTCKIGYHCTASIIVRECNGCFLVEHFKTHYGHNLQLEHLKISKVDKDVIAEKLALGATPKDILDNIKNNRDDSIKRVHLLTHKDIRNVACSLRVGTAAQKSSEQNELISLQEVESASVSLICEERQLKQDMLMSLLQNSIMELNVRSLPLVVLDAISEHAYAIKTLMDSVIPVEAVSLTLDDTVLEVANHHVRQYSAKKRSNEVNGDLFLNGSNLTVDQDTFNV